MNIYCNIHIIECKKYNIKIILFYRHNMYNIISAQHKGIQVFLLLLLYK